MTYVAHPSHPSIKSIEDRGAISKAGNSVGCYVALSARELDVLRLIAAGSSNAEIAESLCVSINTVKTHVRTAYRRIGVERRAQAIVWCFNNNIEVYPNAVL